MPATRWVASSQVAATYGSLLGDGDYLVGDAKAFAITPVEAKSLDPQQVLVLTVGYAALADQGCSRSRMILNCRRSTIAIDWPCADAASAPRARTARSPRRAPIGLVFIFLYIFAILLHYNLTWEAADESSEWAPKSLRRSTRARLSASQHN